MTGSDETDVERLKSIDDRLRSVDALRGIAAVAVMVSHAPRFTGRLHFLAQVQDRGYLGVGLFLVLSGFSIHFRWAAAAELGHFAHGRFWRRRFRRLYPAYLAAFGVSLLVYVVWLNGPISAREWPHFGVPSAGAAIAAQLVLVVANIVPYTYVGVAWTLGLELQLYAMYTVVVRKLRQIGVWRILALSLAGSLLFRALILTQTDTGSISGPAPYGWRMLWTWGPSRMFEWALGMAAAEAYFGRLKLPRISASWIAAAVLLVFAFLVESVSPFRTVAGISPRDLGYDAVFGIAFVVLLRALILAEGRHAVASTVLRPFAWVGFFSYSLYVTHVTLLRANLQKLGDFGVKGGNHLIVLALLLAAGEAFLFHLLFERPFLTSHHEGPRRPGLRRLGGLWRGTRPARAALRQRGTPISSRYHQSPWCPSRLRLMSAGQPARRSSQATGVARSLPRLVRVRTVSARRDR